MGKKKFHCCLEDKKRRVSKFYRQQTNTLESFEADRKHVQEFQQSQLLTNNQFSANLSTMEEGDAAENDANDEKSNAKKSRIKHILNGMQVLCNFLMRHFLKKQQQRSNKSSKSTLLEEPTDVLVVTTTNQDLFCADPPAENYKMSKNRSKMSANNLALLSLFVNICLTFAKAFALYLSGSLSIGLSFRDSLVDITSGAINFLKTFQLVVFQHLQGFVIWMTRRAIKKYDPYLYPAGRSRLEPIGLVIISVIMAAASLKTIVQSVESVLARKINARMDISTNCIMLTTIILKFILCIVCCRYRKDPSARVLALDHRNDCISNTVALICATCAHKYWPYSDPIGAIVVALYITIAWYQTGKEHLLKLSGRSANPEYINRIIKLSIDFDERIKYIGNVKVFHFGTGFFVDVHVVLDGKMRLNEAHDISESLQNVIKSLPDVERASVICAC